MDNLNFIYDKSIAEHVTGKVIDYHTSPQEGFSITGEGPGPECDGCSCE